MRRLCTICARGGSKGVPNKNLDNQTVKRIFDAYRITDHSLRLEAKNRLNADYGLADVKIRMVGVWDTVGALGIPEGLLHSISRYRYRFHDVTLSSWVDRAFHAVAVDEHRQAFLPSLWQQQLWADEHGQIMEQVWFPGSHCDVGGGFPLDDCALSDLTLRWMANRVTNSCALELDLDRLECMPQCAVSIHDSRTLLYQITDFFEGPLYRVIDGGLGKTGARDPLGTKRETMHPAVDHLFREFAKSPIPHLGAPYQPVNVADYHCRLTASGL